MYTLVSAFSGIYYRFIYVGSHNKRESVKNLLDSYPEGIIIQQLVVISGFDWDLRLCCACMPNLKFIGIVWLAEESLRLTSLSRGFE
jgi:hypothetical protein